MAAQEDGLDTEQIGTPETVLEVANECEPRRAIGSGFGSKVFGKDAAHGIFVDLDAKGVRDLLSDSHTAEPWIAPLHLNDGRDELRGRPLGPGLRRCDEEEKSRWYLRSTNAR
jgi:hypothetical protein